VQLNATASNLAAGAYTAVVGFTNVSSGATVARRFILCVGQSLIQNGDFETGDFAFWSVTGDPAANTITAVTDAYPQLVHGGTYAVWLGQVGLPPAHLYQTVPTVAGQAYWISCWLNSSANPLEGHLTAPNEFSVLWNGATLFHQFDLGVIGWTNLQFLVVATGAHSVLDFASRDDNWTFGFDDVTMLPVPLPVLRAALGANNQTLALAWNALTGRVYQAQHAADLLDTNWDNLGAAVIATGATLTATDGLGTNPRQFYRVLVTH